MPSAKKIGFSKASAIAGTDLREFIARFGTLFAAAIIFVVFALITPRFISAVNIINMLVQISVLTVISSSLTIAVASGEFDLSIGQVAGLSGVLVAGFMVWAKLPLFLAMLLPILASIAIGFINGLLVTKLRIPSLIATLAMGPIALGLNYAYDGGDSIYATFPSWFYWIATGRVFGVIPIPVVIAIIVVTIFYILLNSTRLGRAIIATGANITAARHSGIAVNQCRCIALILSALGAGVGGIMLTARLGTGQPGAGEPYLLDSLTAVFLGMTVFRPGSASIQGTLVGVVIIGLLDNGLNLLGAPFYLQNEVRGLVMISAVSLAVMQGEIRFF